MKKLGLYIHIPFCEKKCLYCNFVSYCLGDDVKIKYVQHLIKEIVNESKKYSDYLVDTIFFGGGTPSTLLANQIKSILFALKQNFNVSSDAEITIECNPNSLTEQKLLEYKEAGINRLSIGLQSYNNKLLKTVGRIHSKKDFDTAYTNAVSYGFKNINVDIMLGLPKQKIFDVKNTLKHLIKLGVNHISAYGLILEDETPLKRKIECGEFKLPSEKKSVKMYDFCVKFLKKHRIFRYEVSNFAKNGFESKHNLKYWTGDEYLGLGTTSSSFVNNKRWKNTDSLKIYFDAIDNCKDYYEDIENLSLEDRTEEQIMLSLRTKDGIDLVKFEKQFGYKLQDKKKLEIEKYVTLSMLEIFDSTLRCTDAGFKFLNQIILDLI